jgi:ElaB/YqjD/DUF883 family membrane-anchored ribosome-binding protein
MSKTDNQDIKDEANGVGSRVATAYASAREKAGEAASGIGANPVAAVIGGLAIGAIAGALLPRLEKEKELLAPIGERVNGAARAALEAGKTAGRDALGDAGFSGDALRGQVSKLVDQAISAAGAAGTAAATAAREAASK